MNIVSLVLFTSFTMQKIRTAKILGVFPYIVPSHFFLGSSLMKGLAENGNDVTIISSFAEKNPPKNLTYREVVLTGFWEEAEKRNNKYNIFEEEEDRSPFLSYLSMNDMFLDWTERTLNHTNVQNLIDSNENFDVVIVEQSMSEAFKAFALHFKAPLVIFSTIGANSWINLLVGNPAPTAYVPYVFTEFSSQMTFVERTINSLLYVFNEGLNNFYAFPKHKQLIQTYFPNGLDLYQVLYNSCMILVNSHLSTNQVVPHVPKIVNIGGFHVQPPKKLPNDLQSFLDDATYGVIYFSLGSNLKSSDLQLEKLNAILDVFAKLKQKILWKWELDELPGQTANIKLGKWFSQQDVLAHPNLKLFISRGGLLSTAEAIYHGVPVLAIPIYGDQKLNAHNIVKNGHGLYLSYQNLNRELFGEKLKKLLTDPMFINNAKIKSKVFHDRPISSMDTVTFWMEYIVRHKDTNYLNVAALDMPLYKYFLIDVIVFLLVLILLVPYTIYKCVQIIVYFLHEQKNKL